jgi:anaerobic magnesium-protoporphyrin IX monomethyl ester cyclase
MNKILLIPAPYIRDRHIESYVPYGVFSLQAVACQSGGGVDVFSSYDGLSDISFANSRTLAEAVLSHVNFQDYDTIGLSTMCNSFHHSLNMARCIKELAPEIAIWMGGPHVSAIPEQVLTAFQEVDAVFVGEGEATLLEILDRRARGEYGLQGIAGLYTREDRYAPRLAIENLDKLPYISLAHDFLPTVSSAQSHNLPKRIPLEASRGCPGRCSYCSTRLNWGKRVRRKSDARLISEMRQLSGLTGMPEFALIGDNFGSPRERLLQFCRTMEREGADFVWYCSIKMDRLRLADLDVLWEGNCRGVFVGIESASQDTLDRIRKDIDLERELRMVYRAIEMGFLIVTSFIIGFPWETPEDIDRTFGLHCDLLKRGVFESQMWVLCPLPGTDLTKEIGSQVRFDRMVSGIAMDDIPADEETSELLLRYPGIFSQFGSFETPGVSWIEISATADAAVKLSNLYADKHQEVSPPKHDAQVQ